MFRLLRMKFTAIKLSRELLIQFVFFIIFFFSPHFFFVVDFFKRNVGHCYSSVFSFRLCNYFFFFWFVFHHVKHYTIQTQRNAIVILSGDGCCWRASVKMLGKKIYENAKNVKFAKRKWKCDDSIIIVISWEAKHI